MPHVNVSIDGKQYRMACDDGQENHLTELAANLDGRISSLRSTFGEVGDMRLAIMTALILADELSDAQQRVANAEAEVARAAQRSVDAAAQADAAAAALAASIEAAAERVEKVAQTLNREPAGERVALG